MKKLFTLFIILLLLPFAAWGQTTQEPVEYQKWDGSKVADADHPITDYIEINESYQPTSWGGDESSKEYWYVVKGDVTIDTRVTVTGKVHLILADGCKLTATKGIQVQDDDYEPDTPSTNSLTIYGQEKGSGALEATGGSKNAGIGGSGGENGGTVTIHGGTVSAKSVTLEGDTESGAGIGGGGYGSGGAVTIYGGTVTATSTGYSAGIGGGYNGSGGEVAIYGGTVTATSNGTGAGIGGGYNGSGGAVTIYGGTVTATGEGGGAGIGNGKDYSGTDGTFSTGDSGHAFIIASSDTGDAISDQSGNSNWSGVIFEGDNGSVYGSPITLTTDATIPAGKTLTVENGKTLVVGEGVTLTNEGTLIVYGELKGKVENKGSIPITGITLNQTISLVEGETAPLQATIKPSIATNQALTWSSSNSDVATVENGEVTAVGAGKATITVTTQDGGYTATCEVTVKQHTHSLTKTDYKAPTCTEDGNIEYWYCEGCGKYFSDEAGTTEISLDETVIYATGHHYVNGTCTECGHRDPDYRPDPDPVSYYNIYVEEVCDGVEVSLSKSVVKEGNSISVYVEKDTANYTFDNFKVYYKRSYYGPWEILEEGVQPGEYPIRSIWTHIYVKAEGAEEKEDDPTGMEQVEGVKVYTKDGSLYVQTPQRETVIIVTMTGAVVKNEEQIGLKQYHGLNQGIYIVRVGETAYKLRLH